MTAPATRLLFSTRALIWALALVFLCAPPVAASAPDLLAPEIHSAFPEDGSTVDVDPPTLRVRFGDSGSGILPDSIILALDGLDVTARAELREYPGGDFQMNYTPASLLGDGVHRASLRITDLAGNPARIEWSFIIRTGLLARSSFGGTSSTLFSIWPLTRFSEALDLNLNMRLSSRFSLTGHVRALWTGPLMMAGDDPGLGTFQVPDYAVAVKSPGFQAAVGAVEISLPSNTLLPPAVHSGVSAVFNQNLAGGGYGTLSAFAGQAYQSSGFHMSRFDFAGAGFSAGGEKGAGIAAFAIQTRGDAEPGWLGGCGVELPLGQSGSLFAEGLWAQASGDSGYAGGAGLLLRGPMSSLDVRIFSRNEFFKTPWTAEGIVGDCRTRVSAGVFLALKVPVVFTFNLAAAVSPVNGTESEMVMTGNAVVEGRYLANPSLIWSLRYQGDYSGRPMDAVSNHTISLFVTGSPAPEAGWKAGWSFSPTTGGAVSGFLGSATVFQKVGTIKVFLMGEWAREPRTSETFERACRYSLLLSPWSSPEPGHMNAEAGVDFAVRDRFSASSGDVVGQYHSLSLNAKGSVPLWAGVSLLGNAKLVLSGNGPDLLLNVEVRWAF